MKYELEVKYRVNFFTDDGHLFAWYITDSITQAKGLRRKMKKGYAEIETL